MIVRNVIVLYTPGDLNTGRNTRLTNRAQRRALRALYRCCSIPGCTVSYDRCKLHHIIWWHNGGHTNLDNLIPVCSNHHTNIHNNGWIIQLDPTANPPCDSSTPPPTPPHHPTDKPPPDPKRSGG